MQSDRLIPPTLTAWLIIMLAVNVAAAAETRRLAEKTPTRSQLPPASIRNDPREALTGLNHELADLQQHLSELTAQTMALTGTIRELKFLGVDLTGDWQLTLPAGFTYPAVISRQADGLWRLEVRGVMRGAYRQDGHRFRIAVPSDERLTEFVWEGISPDHLLLIESPPVAKIGSDYRGATLMRTQP